MFAAPLHIEGAVDNMSTFIEKNVYVPLFFRFTAAKRDFFFFLYSTMCTYAPAGRLLIANQKLCFHSDCSSPLWKVFSVVTKTTIQRWQTSVAHSWVDAVSGRLLDKQARRRETGGRWGNQRATTRQREG